MINRPGVLGKFLWERMENHPGPVSKRAALDRLPGPPGILKGENMEGKKSFSEFLRDYEGGTLNEELTDAMNAVVGAVQVCQKEGKVSVEIQVKPNNGHESFMVQARVKLKEPEPARPSAIFYADENLNLVREDPRQMKFSDIEKQEAKTA